MEQNCTIFTIVSNNYFSQAITLMDSVKMFHPNIDAYILIVDKKSDLVDYSQIHGKVLFIDDLGLPGIKSMEFKYSIIELNTAVKPFFIELLQKKYKKIIYLDPDIYLFQSLVSIFDLLDKFSFVITPHKDSISLNFKNIHDLDYLTTGFFNLGFCGISSSKEGKMICSYWKNRLLDYCYFDPEHSLFYDQKWVDQIFFQFGDSVFVDTRPGMNCAPWNLDERKVINKNGTYFVSLQGQNISKNIPPCSELVFFHFSGVNVNHKGSIDYLNDKHHKDLSTFFDDNIKGLFDSYISIMIKNHAKEYSIIKYAFSEYDDGTEIDLLDRKIYFNLVHDGKISEDNPFLETSSFYSLLRKNHLLSKEKKGKESSLKQYEGGHKERILLHFLCFLQKVLGKRKFLFLMKFFHHYSSLSNMQYLVLKKNKYEKND